jgi:N-sulfoglucosamine sulfohydrolase
MAPKSGMSTPFRRLLGIVVLSGWFAATSPAADERPNIVLIIADDMNWDDCGAYGHPSIRTPNIDRLATEGMRFDRAYLTASSCSPSRSSIITGRYPHNTGAEQLHWPLPGDAHTFVEALKASGYYTAAAGKWHLGDAVRNRFDDVFEASMAGFILPTPGADGAPAKMVATSPSGCEDWESTLTNRPKDKPFFMWLAALDPHREYEEGSLVPGHTNEEVVVPVHLPDTPEVRGDLRLYYDEIGRLDLYVGKVLALLEAQGVADNTLVLFITDNGRPFPRDKTTTYEGGIRTPWIVRWPAEVKAGQISQSLVSSVDIAPSFLAVAGLKAGPTFEGENFIPVLTNPQKTVRQYAFAEDHWHDYTDHFDLAGTPSADAGRSPTWVEMTAQYHAGTLTDAQLAGFVKPRDQWELFDTQTDPNELNNLANSPAYAKQLKRMRQALADWTKRTNDFIPTKRTPDEFDRITGEPDHSVRIRPRPSKQDMFGTNGSY